MKITSWIDIGTGRASIEIDGKKVSLGNSEDMREACHRISAAVSFCEGFTTEQLEATSLRELVEAAAKYQEAEMDYIGASYSDDENAINESAGVVAHWRDILKCALGKLEENR